VLVRAAGDKKVIHLAKKEADCFDFAEVYNFNKERTHGYVCIYRTDLEGKQRIFRAVP
jgi:hypothetical protein